MAKQNSSYYIKRDRPKKRPRRHTKSLNKQAKRSFKKYASQGR
tara:strand:- start:386 stop:514 length:129 start_codon:yes stop_codon:yes gene_type:complete